ncbi:histone-lysine N-methyltransferase SETMAR [Trichonephila clavipes]|nr:histone-lysine N-methyltransferase SETMAR [Trichonephila clavipes]
MLLKSDVLESYIAKDFTIVIVYTAISQKTDSYGDSIFWAKNVSASAIHSQIVEVHGEEAISRQHVAKWCHYFQSDRCRKPQYGRERPAKINPEINTAQIEEMILNNRRVTLSVIPSELELSYGSVQHIVSDELQKHLPRPGSMDRDLISTKTG